MGLDITVIRCDVAKCPYCDEPIIGTIRDFVDSGGRYWGEYLEKIGYYAPCLIREKEPDRDFCGKDMMLTSEQAKDLATFAREHDVYDWASIVALVDCAIENGDSVVIDADW